MSSSASLAPAQRNPAALPYLDTISRLKQALKLGCAYLQMVYGIHLATSARTTICCASTARPSITGRVQRFDLAPLNCALTLQQEDVLRFAVMGDVALQSHPCYQHLALDELSGG